MLLATAVSIGFAALWLVAGPLALVPALVILLRHGPSTGKLPSLSTVLMLMLITGALVSFLLTLKFTPPELLELIKPVAELRTVQTSISQAVLAGEPSIAKSFAMEMLGGVFFAFVVLFLMARPGAYRTVLDKAVERLHMTPEAKPSVVLTLAIVAMVLFATSFYVLEPGSRWVFRFSLFLPALPFLWFLSASLVWCLFMPSNEPA